MGCSEQQLVRMYGSGQHTVVLAHGFGLTQDTWSHQVPVLVAAGFRVITFNAAGSSPGTEDYYRPARHRTLYGFAEDLQCLAEENGLRQAVYVGHSCAAMIGLLLANFVPGVFRAMIWIGASARYLDDEATGYHGGFTRSQVDAVLGSMQENYQGWANGFAPLTVGHSARPELATEFAQSLLTLRPDIASQTLATILHADHREDARLNRLPLWMMRTGHDAAVPASAAEWLADAAGARELRVVDTEGHFPHRSAPQAVNEALLAFLGHAAG